MKNPLSLEAFADWCEKQPADAEYCYMDTGHCAYARFLFDVGVPFQQVSGFSWTDEKGRKHYFPNALADALAMTPYTFGALAKRLRSNS